ncbi:MULTISPECIES: hypothetical protein [unclassified Streptomyces]|uniref:hypothetical protein n=1 Tax=unclassified Streptomyces TaxID=2593676 RepID=UPI0033B05086
MDQFEQELARMMRDNETTETPYEERHQVRLRAGVRARQRVRTIWMATGSVLTIAGLGVGLLLASLFAQGGPTSPQPRPVTSAESVTETSTTRPASTAKGAPMPTRTSTTTRVAGWPGSSASGQ